MPSDSMAAAVEPKLGTVLGAIKTVLNRDIIGAGPLAMLRRMDPARHTCEPAFHRLLAAHVPDEWVDRDHAAFWPILVHAMALAAPDQLAFGLGLGRPLFEADTKEGRLTRLLEMPPEQAPVLVPRAVRFLIAHGQKLDPLALAHFLRGINAGGDAAETQRTIVARDYYRAQRGASKT